MDEDAKKQILARRARFVAAALASLATSCKASAPDAEQPGEPRPVVVEIPEAKASGEESDAAPPGRSDAGVAAPEPSVHPRVCLSKMR